VEQAAGVLHTAGVEAAIAPTTAPGSAGQQARIAIYQGYETVIACGGDGTVHEVLQGIAGTGVTLGVIPLGTGNAMAYDLGLPRDVQKTARLLLRARPQEIPLGELQYSQSGVSARRYFLSVAGVGTDAELLYKLAFDFKTRFGMFAYYAVGARLWLTHEFVPFTVEFADAASGRQRREEVTQILAVRVTRFGSLLRQLAPGASMQHDSVQLVLFKTSSRFRYLRYIGGMISAQHWPVQGIETVRTTDVSCSPLDHSRRVYAQADGELLGTLPVRIRMLAESIRLLVPARHPQNLSHPERSEKSQPVTRQ
jgi:YegS/Rv2252/BmrU family lipid kinase